jgi:hypothetical protein
MVKTSSKGVGNLKQNTYHAIFNKIVVVSNFDITNFQIVFYFLTNFHNCDPDVLGLIHDLIETKFSYKHFSMIVNIGSVGSTSRSSSICSLMP